MRQRPLLHLPEQQLESIVHAEPRALHWTEQTPPTQMPPQQSGFWEQAAPICEQTGVTFPWHLPPEHVPAQQSASRLHGASSTRQQDCPTHTATPAANPQHCAFATQFSRSAPQNKGWSRQPLTWRQSSRHSANWSRKSARSPGSALSICPATCRRHPTNASGP